MTAPRSSRITSTRRSILHNVGRDIDGLGLGPGPIRNQPELDDNHISDGDIITLGLWLVIIFGFNMIICIPVMLRFGHLI